MNRNKNRKEQFSKEPFRKSRSVNRILTKNKGDLPDDAKQGIVYQSLGKTFLVKDIESNELINCILGGTVITPYKNINVAAVGDVVSYQTKKTASQGVILKINERKSKLSRNSVKKTENEQIIAANLDQVMIFISANNPAYNKRLIDRYLVTCRMYRLPAVIVVNKIDVADLEEIKNDLKVYSELDYKVIFISLIDKINLEDIYSVSKDKTTLITGPSGAGKSTLINYLFSDQLQKIGKVSDTSSKGKHTTSFVQMFDLDENTRVIDTPGLREFGIWNLDKNELQMYFSDFDEYREECKFIPCSHTHEPGCVVKEAVVNGEIDEERYESYLHLYENCE